MLCFAGVGGGARKQRCAARGEAGRVFLSAVQNDQRVTRIAFDHWGQASELQTSLTEYHWQHLVNLESASGFFHAFGLSVLRRPTTRAGE